MQFNNKKGPATEIKSIKTIITVIVAVTITVSNKNKDKISEGLDRAGQKGNAKRLKGTRPAPQLLASVITNIGFITWIAAIESGVEGGDEGGIYTLLARWLPFPGPGAVVIRTFLRFLILKVAVNPVGEVYWGS